MFYGPVQIKVTLSRTLELIIVWSTLETTALGFYLVFFSGIMEIPVLIRRAGMPWMNVQIQEVGRGQDQQDPLIDSSSIRGQL